jgi:hypothetical protein
MENPITWEYMETVPGPNEVFGPLAIIYLIVFGLGFVLSVFLYNDGARHYVDHPVKRRVIRRGAGVATAVFGVGLFFFGIRVLQIDPFTFGRRMWLWLSALAALIMAIYFIYYARVVYPARLTAYEEQQRKQRYIRPPAGAGARPAASANVAAYRASGRPTKRRRK